MALWGRHLARATKRVSQRKPSNQSFTMLYRSRLLFLGSPLRSLRPHRTPASVTSALDKRTQSFTKIIIDIERLTARKNMRTLKSGILSRVTSSGPHVHTATGQHHSENCHATQMNISRPSSTGRHYNRSCVLPLGFSAQSLPSFNCSDKISQFCKIILLPQNE